MSKPSYQDVIKERDAAIAAFNKMAEDVAHMKNTIYHMENELRKREKNTVTGGDRCFTTGAYIEQIKLKENWAWVVTEFIDDTFKNGESVEVEEFVPLDENDKWVMV